MSKDYIVIVPPSRQNGPSLASGTKIFNQDGEEIKGVTRISLSAAPGDVWKANLEVLANFPDVIKAKVDRIDYKALEKVLKPAPSILDYRLAQARPQTAG